MKKLLIIMVLLLPVSLLAQKSDGFFRYQSDDIYGDRSNGVEAGIYNYGIGQSVPVGGGLLVLAAAGACYAVARRNKKNSRHINIMMLAAVMLLGMTQCKKNVEQIVPSAVSEPDGVHITLTVGDGSKVNVTPGFVDPQTQEVYAKVDFENGDKLYVGNNGAYCGYLTYSETDQQFAGNINPTSEADYLHFYFMGNKAGDLNDGDTECTFDIIDQTSKYPVVSYGRSTSLYVSGKTDYSAKLGNYCAIVKFVTSYATEKVLTIKGLNNQVTLNFAANNTNTPVNPYSYSKADTDGSIQVHAEGTEGTEKWAIILPNTSSVSASARAFGLASAENFTIPVLAANAYYTNNDKGIWINLALPGVYTGNADKRFVFAPGNVQYNAAENKWRFAEHQWDVIGATNNQISPTYNGWIDLFGWGTGQNPTLATDNNPDYPISPTTLMNRVNDWGVNFTSKSNGTDDGFWCTLTGNDWVELMNRQASSLRANGTVNDVKGVILLPDNWASVSPKPYNFTIKTKGGAFTDNVIDDAEKWAELEDLGCVFLPIGGYRHPGYTNNVYNLTSIGYYWSTMENNDDTKGVYFIVKKDGTECQINETTTYKKFGHSVRLAHYIN